MEPGPRRGVDLAFDFSHVEIQVFDSRFQFFRSKRHMDFYQIGALMENKESRSANLFRSGGRKMKKKFSMGITVVIFLLFMAGTGWTDVIKNVRVKMTPDRSGFKVQTTWDVNYKHWKYDFNTITRKAGIWMDCITSYDRRGHMYKAVVGSSLLPGLTKSSGKGTLSCHISKKVIPSRGHYMWVRIKVKIAGNWEKPIWLYAGKVR